jgi:HEAT repeat protein
MENNTHRTVKALNVITLLNAAVKNVRLYPPESASVVNALDRLDHSIADFLADEQSLVFAESEKALLIDNRPLRQADHEKPHLMSMLNLLMSFGLKSISFERGVSRQELADFLDFFSRMPESVKNEGGLAGLMAERNITRITLDQKVYVAVSKDHQIAAALDITDDEVVRFILQALPEMDPASEQFQDMAGNPETLVRAFDATMSRIMAQKGMLSDLELTESLADMLSLLDRTAGGLDDENQISLARHVGRALAGAVPEIAEHLTAQNMAHLLGGFLLQFLMAELAQGAADGADAPDGGLGGDAVGEEERKARLMEVAGKFSLHLQSEKMLLDEGLMSALPEIISQLIAYKEQEAMETLLERLTANLTSEKEEIRLSAARGLADIIENLPAEQKRATVQKLSGRLIGWLGNENVFSPDYKRICQILKDEADELIAQKSFTQALMYLDAFRTIASSAGDKPDEMKDTALEIIRQLVIPENIAALQGEMDPADREKQDEAGRVFAALGRDAVVYLLERLRTSPDSGERVRAMHLITYARQEALPLINELITRDAPWFYLRNLAYLLGQIGDEQSADNIAWLLSSTNQKLRFEALKSIHKIGGEQRGRILLAALSEADDEFKSAIVEVLGQSRSAEAVPVLVDLLRERPLIASAARTLLEEKICLALGSIGNPDAIGPLVEVAETKSFLRLRAYPDKVKASAARSLVILREKVAASGKPPKRS